MTNQLENQIASYQRWREDIRSGIEAYQAWLDQHGHVDIQRSLRIYDLLESLRNDRMVLAFLAEYSRGKTELINAMFFADFKQRLLPSDVGRTTMCPTEVFYDPAEEPYIRLLPIETRKREDSIASLKQHPVEWVKIKLNLQSQEEMANAMASLAETKQVRVEEASDAGPARPEGLRDHHRGHARQQGRDPGVAPRDDQLPAPAAQERAGDSRHAWLERPGHRARAHAQDDPERARHPVPAGDGHRRDQVGHGDLAALRAELPDPPHRGAEQDRPAVGRVEDRGRRSRNRSCAR